MPLNLILQLSRGVCFSLIFWAANGQCTALADIETITVMPVLLSENLKLKDPDKFQKNVHKILLRKLAMKGYVLDKPRKWQAPKAWNANRVRAISATEVAAMLPEHARYAALLFVEDLSKSNLVVVSSAKARVSAMILDRHAKEVLWEKRKEGKSSESWFALGVLGMLITPDRYFALERAFANLFKDFPEKTR